LIGKFKPVVYLYSSGVNGLVAFLGDTVSVSSRMAAWPSRVVVGLLLGVYDADMCNTIGLIGRANTWNREGRILL
jgi:hypothetical protein